MSNFMVIDTETMNAAPDDRKNLLVYDIGFAIIDEQGKVKEKYSFVVRECFFGMYNIMQQAYYANKIPLYLDEIQKGKRKVWDFMEIYSFARILIKKYGVCAVVGHNMGFDYSALNATLRYLTKSRFRFFFPYNMPLFDTLKMARNVWGRTDKYKRFCKKYNYLTKNNQPRFTAEILYRYITKDFNFTEAHIGLEDVMIEKYIFVACYNCKKCKKMLLFENRY